MIASSEGSVSVSVVMPAFNAQRYIAATINSVLSQTYRDFELLIVDDCSSDRTPEIVERMGVTDARVRLVRLTKNYGGPAGPRNVGVRTARGEWIAFIDADDIWHPQKLISQLRAVMATGAAFCSTQMIDFEDERALAFTDPGECRLERIGFLKQLVKIRTPTSSVLVRKELASRHPFNEAMTFKAREDLDCWLHCHEEIGWSIKIAHPLVGYRIIRGQISGQKWRMVRRHFHVLRQYRFRSGATLGIGAALFTCSHFLLAVYYRVLKRAL